MDLDAPPLHRSRDTPSSCNRLSSPIQMSLRRELKPTVFRCQELLSQSFPAPETTLLPVPHRNVAHVTPSLPRSAETMPPTPPFQSFPGRETAPVTPRVENSKFAESEPSSVSVPVQHPMFSASTHLQYHPRCPRILLIDSLTFHRKLTKVTENQQLTRSPMIHFSLTTLL